MTEDDLSEPLEEEEKAVDEPSQDWPIPLPDDQYSTFELWATRVLLATLGILFLGSILIPSIFWDAFLGPMVWDPVIKDAEQGDSGYNSINTMLFTVVLLLFVIALSARFRKMGLPADPRTILVFIPWVVMASVVRVLEDSELFPSSYQAIFISPIIHFHLAVWVILAALLGHWADRKSDKHIISEVAIKGRFRMVVIGILLLMWIVMYASAFSNNPDVGPLWTIPGLMVSILIACWLAGDTSAEWSGIERSLFSVGWGAVLMGLAFWMQFSHYPWHSATANPAWPVLIILGIPTLICWQMYRWGNPARMKMLACGYEPGILPEGISLDEWEKGEPEIKKEYEADVRWALLADPLVLAFTFGQLCDGLATWVGIDFFGYSEKHVVSSQIIEWGQEITGSIGAWLFFLVKAALTTLLILVFTQVRVEHRQRHLRVLIVLALLIVGLAPGLRDLGRLLLGV
jgi:uncharacterized membrane protein